jgi:hypothetical protein
MWGLDVAEVFFVTRSADPDASVNGMHFLAGVQPVCLKFADLGFWSAAFLASVFGQPPDCFAHRIQTHSRTSNPINDGGQKTRDVE